MADPDQSLAAEFDTIAEWTATVALEMPLKDRVPAGCRGSSSPGALRWFLDRLGLSTGQTFLDCGAGVGGPAAFAAAEAGVRPVLTDREPGACRAARVLFGLPTIRADHRLPIGTGTVHSAWSLGVLCTVQDQPAFLNELRRVLRPDGRLGLLVYAAAHGGELSSPPPRGNAFPPRDSLPDLLATASLRVEASALVDDFAETPVSWQHALDKVEHRLRTRHRNDKEWQTAQEQSARMGRLIADGEVLGTMLLAVAT